VPFLFTAAAFNSATRTFAFFKRRYAAIQVGSGLVLMAMGVLVLNGEFFRLNIEVQQFLDGFGLNFFQSV
jgi:cytochrome c-type biogenesis protein